MTAVISVALCTFNGAHFISEQVASILAQSRMPDEIVLSDDGSTDSTVVIAQATVDQFRRDNPDRAPELRLLCNPVALGVTRNFEQAIAATRGDYVALCDQDDRWRFDRVELAAARFDTEPDLLLLNTDARLIDGDGNPLGDTLFAALAVTNHERAQIARGDALRALLGRNLVTGATTMFRRTLLDAAVPFPPSWVHDEWLAVIAAATGRINFIEDTLIDYRQHGGNAIGAGRIGMSGRMAKLREPRSTRNRQLVDRASALVDRLGELGGVSADKVQLAQGKLAHETLRQALPAGRITRIGPVVRELRAGGYSAYGRGLQDVLRDVVQPSGD